jgi:hypothetical protein
LNNIARMPGNERAELFAETAERKGVADAIVEKDFWVCWILKQLFSIETLSGRRSPTRSTDSQKTSVRRDGAGGIYDLVIASQTC